MTRSMIGVVAMLLGSLPTEAQVIHLLCDGSVKIPELDNNKPRRYEKDMKMIIDLNNRTVAFSDLTARITKIDADYAYLVHRDSTRGMWGHIDRVGGTAQEALLGCRTRPLESLGLTVDLGVAGPTEPDVVGAFPGLDDCSEQSIGLSGFIASFDERA
jgi:hypothetical protein